MSGKSPGNNAGLSLVGHANRRLGLHGQVHDLTGIEGRFQQPPQGSSGVNENRLLAGSHQRHISRAGFPIKKFSGRRYLTNAQEIREARSKVVG